MQGEHMQGEHMQAEHANKQQTQPLTASSCQYGSEWKALDNSTPPTPALAPAVALNQIDWSVCKRVWGERGRDRWDRSCLHV